MKKIKNIITKKMVKEFGQIRHKYEGFEDEIDTLDIKDQIERVIRLNGKKYMVKELMDVYFIYTDEKYAVIKFDSIGEDNDRDIYKLRTIKEHLSPRKFVKDLYHWINNEVISKGMKYYSQKKDLYKDIKKHERFGLVGFDKKDIRKINNWGILSQNASDEDFGVEWTGEGRYVGWSWEDEHIQRIDDVYDEWIEEYRKKGFEEPDDEDVDALYEKMYENII